MCHWRYTVHRLKTYEVFLCLLFHNAVIKSKQNFSCFNRELKEYEIIATAIFYFKIMVACLVPTLVYLQQVCFIFYRAIRV